MKAYTNICLTAKLSTYFIYFTYFNHIMLVLKIEP